MTRSLVIRLGYGVALLLGIQLWVAGCGGGGKATGSTDPGPQTPSNFDFGSNSALRATAFGDSLTRGVLGEANDRDVVTSNNYPNNLQAALQGLNPGFRVINRGLSGEVTTDGRRRLGGVLAVDRPGFVLIMEGTNDAGRDSDPALIVANLEAMVIQVQNNRTIPVLGTIPPDFRNDPVAQDIIRVANTRIRTMASARGVVLAEIFDGMNDRSLFGSPERGLPDPLHPNERGYLRMAGIWFTAMQQAIPAAAPTPPPPTVPAPTSTESGQRPKAR